MNQVPTAFGDKEQGEWISFPFWDRGRKYHPSLENPVVRINLKNGLIMIGEGQSLKQYHSTEFHSVLSRVKKDITLYGYRVGSFEMRAEYVSVILQGKHGEVELVRFSDPAGVINDWSDHVKARELRQLLATYLDGFSGREYAAVNCSPDIPSVRLKDLGVPGGESLKELSKKERDNWEKIQFGSKSLAFLGLFSLIIPLLITILISSTQKFEHFLMFGIIGLFISTFILIVTRAIHSAPDDERK